MQKRWPNGHLNYILDPSVEECRDAIEEAVAQIKTAAPCVNITEIASAQEDDE